MSRNVVYVCATAIILAIIGLVGWVSYTGGDLERILGWSGTILAPLVPSIAAYLTVQKVQGVAQQAQKDIQVVKVQTNGKMKRFGDRLDAAEKAIEENGA